MDWRRPRRLPRRRRESDGSAAAMEMETQRIKEVKIGGGGHRRSRGGNQMDQQQRRLPQLLLEGSAVATGMGMFSALRDLEDLEMEDEVEMPSIQEAEMPSIQEAEMPSIQEVVMPSIRGRPTPPDEDSLARLLAEGKTLWDALDALFEAQKAAWEKRLLEGGSEEEDDCAVEATQFRDTWNRRYSGLCGCFEDTTKIPNMRFTFKKPELDCDPTVYTTLQIFSVKVARIRGGLQWPLNVFGKVAMRDRVDRNRNMIFDRPRDSCQILTREVPYLELTGPTRAVVMLDPATFEVDLKVKGPTESEDKCLSFLAKTFSAPFMPHSQHLVRDFASRLSTVKVEVGLMVLSLEATVALRITSGSWPDGYRAQFTAGTTSISAEVMLLDSGNEKVSVGHGKRIMLSRSVVSVEEEGLLKVCAKALQGDKTVMCSERLFEPKSDGASEGSLSLGFCTLGVTVSWSLLSSTC